MVNFYHQHHNLWCRKWIFAIDTTIFEAELKFVMRPRYLNGGWNCGSLENKKLCGRLFWFLNSFIVFSCIKHSTLVFVIFHWFPIFSFFISLLNQNIPSFNLGELWAKLAYNFCSSASKINAFSALIWVLHSGKSREIWYFLIRVVEKLEYLLNSVHRSM